MYKKRKNGKDNFADGTAIERIMKMKDPIKEVKKAPPRSATYRPESERFPGNKQNSVPGINSPEISPPAFNPPIPNRAWTAMRNGVDIDELSEAEKRDLYLGNDNYL